MINLSESNTNFQIFILCLSLTYFIYDTLVCTYYKLADTALIFHHFFASLTFIGAIWTGYGASECMGGIFVT